MTKKAQNPPPPPKTPPGQQQPPGQHPHQAMGTVPIDLRLFAVMERSAMDGILATIRLTGGPAGTKAVLSQDRKDLDAVTFPLARIARGLLPIGTVDPIQMGVLQRQLNPTVRSLVGNVADGLRTLKEHNVPFKASADPIVDLMGKSEIFAGLELLGLQVNDIGMDQREVVGGFMVFALDRMLDYLDKRITDPNVPQPLKNKLLDDFGPALMDLDDVLRNPQLVKDALAAQSAALGQQVQDAQAEAQLKDAAMRVRQQLVMPREMLFAAARRYVQQRQQGPAVLANQPPQTPPPAGGHQPRKIKT